MLDEEAEEAEEEEAERALMAGAEEAEEGVSGLGKARERHHLAWRFELDYLERHKWHGESGPGLPPH